eukprot:7911546-Pyramimonas_sp.AAC.1
MGDLARNRIGSRRLFSPSFLLSPLMGTLLARAGAVCRSPRALCLATHLSGRGRVIPLSQRAAAPRMQMRGLVHFLLDVVWHVFEVCER